MAQISRFILPSVQNEPVIGGRDFSFDFVKGVTIALMIYGHTERVGSMHATWNYLVQWIYSFHMPVFLIISGYLFLPRLHKKDILKPLMQRLALPYFIFVTLYLVGLTAAQRAGFRTSNTPPESLGEFLAAVFLHGAGALWFVHALIVLQLIFALSRFVADRFLSNMYTLWFLAICLSSVAVSVGIIKDWVVMYFMIGLVMRQMEAPLKTKGFLGVPVIVVFLLLSQGTPIDISLLQIGWVLSVIGTLMYLSMLAPSFLVSLFVWFGQNTLIFLVSHALFTVSLKPFAYVMTGIEPTGVLFSAVVLTVALTGGLMIARLADVTGLTPYLFGVQRIYVSYAPISTMHTLKT